MTPDGGLGLTPFERAARQVAEEERRLRLLSEERLRDFARLAVEFAGVFLPGELDARLREDPLFVQRASATDWRGLLQAAQQRRPGLTLGWRGADSLPGEADAGRKPYGTRPALTAPDGAPPEDWQAEARRLQDEVQRLTAELAAARMTHPPVSPPAAPPTPPAARPTAPMPGLTKPKLVLAPGVARVPEIALPGMPALAPGRFADQLRNWNRESVALAALGVTGWSMRFAVTELAAAHLGGRTSAANLRRTFESLAAGRFTVEDRVLFDGVHGAEPELDRERTTLVLVRLTALGREVLRACGIEAAPSEWDQLLAADGEAGMAYIGLACAFAYHARRRGYRTWVGPPDDEAVCGDMRVQLVEAGSPAPQEDLVAEVAGARLSAAERDARRHRQLDRQGRLALVALTPAARAQMVAEAQAAGAAHGAAADLQTLLDAQDKGGALWSETW